MDEQTTTQSVASENDNKVVEQTLEDSSTQDQSVPTEEENLVPEKFVGKSAYEIAEAYKDVEKDRGRLASELGTLRKEREELEEKYRQVERQSMQYQQMPTQNPPQQVQSEQDMDPLNVFESRFDEDPKAAIAEAFKAQREFVSRQTQEQSIQQRAAQAQDFYFTQKRDNSDYARREAAMKELVSEYQDIIRPEYLNSVKTLKALDLMSKGRDLSYYEKQAISRAQEDGLSKLEEKRRAQSISTNSDGDGQIRAEDLTLEEMEKLYGFSDE